MRLRDLIHWDFNTGETDSSTSTLEREFNLTTPYIEWGGSLNNEPIFRTDLDQSEYLEVHEIEFIEISDSTANLNNVSLEIYDNSNLISIKQINLNSKETSLTSQSNYGSSIQIRLSNDSTSNFVACLTVSGRIKS